MTVTENAPPPSLSGWQARAIHTITVPSGQRLKIRIPGIATLLEHGDLPDDLVDLALAEVTKPDGAAGEVARLMDADEDREKALVRLAQFGTFQKQLVCCAVLEVERDGVWQPVSLSLADLDDLPEDDLAMVAEIVQRLRGKDARGVTIGVEPVDRWRRFHDHHGLDAEGCGSCAAFLDELSTSDVGQV